MKSRNSRPSRSLLSRVAKELSLSISVDIVEVNLDFPRHSRRDQGDVAEFTIKLSNSDKWFVRVARNLEKYKKTIELFNKSLPGIGVNVRFVGRFEEWDVVASDFIIGESLDVLVAKKSLDVESAFSIAKSLYDRLEESSITSTIQNMENELWSFLDKVQECPQFNLYDFDFLRCRIWPKLLEEFSREELRLSWTNGDFIARNILLSGSGDASLIDYEYTSQTHFLWLDILRWRQFSGSVELNCLANRFDSSFRATPAKLILFLTDQIVRDTISLGVLGSSSAVARNALILKEQIISIDADYANSRIFCEEPSSRRFSSKFVSYLQLFWSSDGRFRELDSKKCEFNLDTYIEATVETTRLLGSEVVLRIDLGEQEAFIELEKIVVLNKEGEILYVAGGDIGWEKVKAGGSSKVVFHGDRLCILSLGVDPFLILPALSLSQTSQREGLTVKMFLIVHSNLEKIRHYLDHNRDHKYETRILNLQRELENTKSQNGHARTEVENLRTELNDCRVQIEGNVLNLERHSVEISRITSELSERDSEIRLLVDSKIQLEKRKDELSKRNNDLDKELGFATDLNLELRNTIKKDAAVHLIEIESYKRDSDRKQMALRKALKRLEGVEKEAQNLLERLQQEVESKLNSISSTNEPARSHEMVCESVAEVSASSIMVLGTEVFDLSSKLCETTIESCKNKHFRNLGVWSRLTKRSSLEQELTFLKDSPLFWTEWYLRYNSDVNEKSIDPLDHFLKFGWKEGRNPNPLFDTKFYLSKYPDVAESGFNPLVHWLVHGFREKRMPNALFDTEWYLSVYKDVAGSSIDPLSHYLLHGVNEGRQPNSLFLSTWYRLEYGDDLMEGEPLTDFLLRGWKIGRRPNPLFDTAFYLRRCPALLKFNINPLQHYRNVGFIEGRLPSLEFDPKEYRSRFEIAIDDDPLSDHLERCRRENKKVYPVKETAKALKLRNDMTVLTDMAVPIRWDHHIDLVRSFKGKVDPVYTLSESLRNLCYKRTASRSLSFSVIMPCWNRRGTIERAINSILAQSHPVKEILVCDDGSTDGTISQLENVYSDEILKGILRICRIEHRGVSAARNEGLVKATGDLIAYLDSDNCWEPDYLLVHAAMYASSDELNCSYTSLHSLNEDTSETMLRGAKYERKRLLDWNFIDLNTFVHRRILYELYGGFDESLKRLVDWDFILRYTKYNAPAFLPYVGVRYFLSASKYQNITFTENLEENRRVVLSRNIRERIKYGLEPLRLAYILWDFPALSQTFVLLELEWLVKRGYDVKVYYRVDPDRAAKLNFTVSSYKVDDHESLAALLIQHCRNFCHSHFAYPAVTLLAYPACKKLNIPFTFMPHAVDVFHEKNDRINNIGIISKDPLCVKVFVHGLFHQSFLEKRGVPCSKMAHMLQAFDSRAFISNEKTSKCNSEEILTRIIFIGRFVEKKGLKTLLDAISLLPERLLVVDLYGYGPEEVALREIVNERQLLNVNFRGPLEGSKAVLESMRESDLFVLPCERAVNGDMDGFPTVIFEAMAMGLPVLTTRMAAIPNYIVDEREAILVEPGSAEALARGITRFLGFTKEKKEALVSNAKAFVTRKAGVDKTMCRLVDEWTERTIDIFLVTHNKEGDFAFSETKEILERAFEFTSTPFTVTVVDNCSSHDAVEGIISQLKGKANARFIGLRNNLMCGPASNIALMHATSEFAIYLCSKEAFVGRPAWERPMIETMRKNRRVALAGHRSFMPKFVSGREYCGLPSFSQFRNREYAIDNPDRIFSHVQGGLYIINRNVFLKHGGFSDAVPHNGTDVELSYYYESIGYRLEDVSEIKSITTKTLPRIESVIDEETVAAHPLNKQSSELLSLTSQTDSVRCPICSWMGDQFLSKSGGIQVCPSCSSNSFTRNVFKILARDFRVYRAQPALLISSEVSLLARIVKMFNRVDCLTLEEFLASDGSVDGSCDYCIIILDSGYSKDLDMVRIWPNVYHRLSLDGLFLFRSDQTNPSSTIDYVSSSSIPAHDIGFQPGDSKLHGCLLEFVAAVDLASPFDISSGISV